MSTSVEAIARAAAQLESTTERSAYLDRACGSDAALRHSIELTLAGWSRAAPPPAEGGSATAPVPALPHPAVPPLEMNLGHYRVLEVIGRGAMGIVLKAFDEKLHRVVAIKMLAVTTCDDAAGQRFIREARAAAAISHENVVAVHTVEENHAPPYLVMQYVEGASLQDKLAWNKPLPVPDVVRISWQIAAGLAAAHRQGLIHRDIKPANILITSGRKDSGSGSGDAAKPDSATAVMPAADDSCLVPGSCVKLTDFGLARAASDPGITQEGMIVGTPAYMSPEQARGDPIDQRSDLFSLGSVMYHMATGQRPFNGDSTHGVLLNVIAQDPKPVRELNPAVPAWLADLIARLMAKKPAERFVSADEVVAELEYRLGLRKRPPSARSPHERRRAARRRALAVGGAALGLGMFAAGLFLWTRDRGAAVTSGTPSVVASASTAPAATPIPRGGYVNAVGLAFVRVPKGVGWLGGGGGKAGKRTEFADDFYLGAFEVTQDQWERVLGRAFNPSHFKRQGQYGDRLAEFAEADLGRFPVDSVSWNDCQTFLHALNTQCRELGWTYRLPTSAEWEYACRGGPATKPEEHAFHYYLDKPTNTLPAHAANYKVSALQRTQPVGSYAPNRLGLYDMHGNVFEHTHDQELRRGERLCLLRGGCWHDTYESCRAGNINLLPPQSNYEGGGLRVARVPAK